MPARAHDLGSATIERALVPLVGVFLAGGMLNSVEALIVPRLKLMLGLGYAQALTIQLAYYASYLVFACPAMLLVARHGATRATAAGAATIAIGTTMLAGALAMRSFAALLAALLLTSAGVTILQIGCNGAVATSGDRDRATARFAMLQGFNSLGTVAGPLIAAGAILGGTGAMLPLPFLGFAMAFAALALAFGRAPAAPVAPAPGGARVPELLRTRAMLGGIAAIFAYVGAEVTIGTLAPSYLMLPDRGGWTPIAAGRLVSLYWLGAMIGRFAGAWLLRRTGPRALLATAAVLAMALAATAALPTGAAGAVALLAIGLANSIMFPTVFALAMPPTARDMPAASMLLCMAVVGGAIVPVATGAVADRAGLGPALLLPMACYAVILAFSRARTR